LRIAKTIIIIVINDDDDDDDDDDDAEFGRKTFLITSDAEYREKHGSARQSASSARYRLSESIR
jgi:hypothetical protein